MLIGGEGLLGPGATESSEPPPPPPTHLSLSITLSLFLILVSMSQSWDSCHCYLLQGQIRCSAGWFSSACMHACMLKLSTFSSRMVSVHVLDSNPMIGQ